MTVLDLEVTSDVGGLLARGMGVAFSWALVTETSQTATTQITAQTATLIGTSSLSLS
jgi:phosphopantothenate synthetase